MSKLYGKMWSEGNVGKMSTRQGNHEFTSQILYGSKDDSRIAAEVTVKTEACPHGKVSFKLSVYIPSIHPDEMKFTLPWE